MWWKIIIVVALLVSVIIQIFRLRTSWCPHCKKRTGDRYGDKGEDGPTYCSKCLDIKHS